MVGYELASLALDLEAFLVGGDELLAAEAAGFRRQQRRALWIVEDIVIEEVCQRLAAVPLGKDGEYGHAPRATFTSRLHDSDWQAEAIREDLLADDRRLEETALRDHDIRLDALLLDEDVHANLERSSRRAARA